MSEQRGAAAAFDVAGRAAVVTGAARGIGRGVALELARAGAALVLGDVDETGLAEPSFVTSQMTGRHVLREDGSVDETRMQDVIAGGGFMP